MYSFDYISMQPYCVINMALRTSGGASMGLDGASAPSEYLSAPPSSISGSVESTLVVFDSLQIVNNSDNVFKS